MHPLDTPQQRILRHAERRRQRRIKQLTRYTVTKQRRVAQHFVYFTMGHSAGAVPRPGSLQRPIGSASNNQHHPCTMF